MQREDTQPTGQQRTGADGSGRDAYGQSTTGMPQMGAGMPQMGADRMQEPPVVTEPQRVLPGWTREAQGTAPGLPAEPMGKAARHIGEKEIAEAAETLRKYKAGKANLEARIIDNEQWWKLRHWQSIRHGGDRDPKPTSAWLVNACLAKHADAMAAYPEANMLPREPGDRDEAKRLSSIVPVILQQADYEMTWSDCWWKKIKSGVGVTGVFWDPGKLFQSTRPLRGATRWPAAGAAWPNFNPRAPCGARPCCPAPWLPASYFNPRAPCGARPERPVRTIIRSQFQSTRPLRGATAGARLCAAGAGISIHAPLAGRDDRTDDTHQQDDHFNPRAPCGARQQI